MIYRMVPIMHYSFTVLAVCLILEGPILLCQKYYYAGMHNPPKPISLGFD